MSAKNTKEGSITTSTTRKPVIHAPKLIKVAKADQPLYQRVIDAAKAAAERAYRPYSNYNVGAAVLTFDGKIYPGCNVENCGYTQTKHAEEVAVCHAIARAALQNALAAGRTQFDFIVAVAVHAPKGNDPWPCCNCRQFLNEFGLNMDIIGEGPNGEILCKKLGKLIPHAFPMEEVLASVAGTAKPKPEDLRQNHPVRKIPRKPGKKKPRFHKMGRGPAKRGQR